MKRIFALFLSAALLLALLGGCSESGAQSSGDPSGNPSVNPTGNPSGSPTQSAEPSQEPSEPVQVDLEKFLWAIADAYELPALDLPPAEWVSQYYPGLLDIPAEQCIVALGMMSPPVCQVVLVQVTNSSDVQAVCDILQAHIDYMIETDAAYNVEQWQTNASVEVSGNYIMMIANAHHDSIVADFNAIITDPSYVPVAPPDSGNDDPDGPDEPGGGIGGGLGPIPMPVPGGDTEPGDDTEGDNSEPGGGIGGGLGPIPMPVPGGDADPDGGTEGDDSEPGGGIGGGLGPIPMPVPGGDADPDGGTEGDDSESGGGAGGGFGIQIPIG